MQFGFEIRLNRDGPAEFRIFAPEREAPDVPILTFARDARTGAAVAFVGQLFYCAELPQSVRGTGLEKALSNAELVLQIFRGHGTKGLERLEGAFALAVFDPDERRIIVQRDPLGVWPLYYCCAYRRVRVGTSLLSLAAQVPGANVDPGFVGRFLMFTSAFVERPEEKTAFTGLRRVLPGTQLALCPGRQSEQLWRYSWRWNNEQCQPTNMTLEEAGTCYTSLLRQAVEERTRHGRPAAHLSGGMDSSSIVCFAREIFSKHPQRRRLPTLSLVYELESLACEQSYIDLVLQQGGPIEPKFLRGDDLLAFGWFDREIPPHDEPYPGLFYLAAERALVDAAAGVGATNVLSGAGAELTAEGNRLHMADLLRRGRVLATLREARRWSLVRNESAWSVLRRTAIAPSVPPMLRDGVRVFLRGGHGRWPALGRYSIPPWIRRSFARAHGLRREGLDWARFGRRFPIERAAYRIGLGCAAGSWAGWYLAGPVGIHVSRPFLDPRVIEFALGLPRELREVPGVSKPLLSAGMRGVLPQPIRTRIYKRGFNDVFFMGLARHLAPLEDLVRRSRVDDLGLLDKALLIDAMRQHAHGIGQTAAGDRISRTLALIAWLDRLSAWQRPLTGATAVHWCDAVTTAGTGQVKLSMA
ncbi:MAG: asparagine synthase-related protein [Nitrococcus sp.]|nr:asparagine synthase-related protein [Nitrococcus sp.]